MKPLLILERCIMSNSFDFCIILYNINNVKFKIYFLKSHKIRQRGIKDTAHWALPPRHRQNGLWTMRHKLPIDRIYALLLCNSLYGRKWKLFLLYATGVSGLLISRQTQSSELTIITSKTAGLRSVWHTKRTIVNRFGAWIVSEMAPWQTILLIAEVSTTRPEKRRRAPPLYVRVENESVLPINKMLR